jgi:hypothetical protein
MKYTPAAIGQDDLDVAQAPYFGGEFAVYLSDTPAVQVGQIELSASGSGTYTAAVGVTLPTDGVDLQLVATTRLRSPGGNCVVVLNVTDENNIARTATATFAPPARAANQTGNFPRGAAVDFTLSGGTRIKTIVSLASVSNGEANVAFAVYQLPVAADWALVGCTTSKKFNTKARTPKGIDCGMETDAYVKRGKTQPGELSIDSKFGGVYDRLTRFSGSKCTAMLVGVKDGEVTCDRYVFTQYQPVCEVDLPDGDGEAMENAATGKFQEPLFFVAP